MSFNIPGRLNRFNKVYLIISLLALAALIVLIILFRNQQRKVVEGTELVINEADTTSVDSTSYHYGFNFDSFKVTNGRVKSNDILAKLISGYQVKNAQLIALLDSFNTVFDARKIRSGNTYVLLSRHDSIERLYYFIYEINRVDFAVFSFVDSMYIQIGHKAIDTLERQVAGEITSSLWVDMNRIGASPELISKMSDVYAWEIDFFRISKGDKFKLIYESLQIEGKEAGIGRILAAEFGHQGHAHYAILFNQNKRPDYFDSTGACLRKMFLKAPLQYSRISSHFSTSRYHPVLKRYRPHYGVDYAAAYGTPVSAVGDGTVIFAAYSGGAGNLIKIRHNSVYTTAYMHLSKFGKGIKKGASVKQGQVIGYVGSTGLSTGPHLDYRVWKNGSHVNPLTLDLPPVESVEKDNLDAFYSLRDSMIQRLVQIPYSE